MTQIAISGALIVMAVAFSACSSNTENSPSSQTTTPQQRPLQEPPTPKQSLDNAEKVTPLGNATPQQKPSKETPTAGKPLDAATRARIDKIKLETIPILASFVHPEKFSQEQRQRLMIQGLNKGWPAMIADLEFLVAHLPPDDPEREGLKALLEAAKKAQSK
jgi:hypothetical protein